MDTTARTTDWTARTARATRSLRDAERLTGEARAEALRAHFAQFMPRRGCPIHR